MKIIFFAIILSLSVTAGATCIPKGEAQVLAQDFVDQTICNPQNMVTEQDFEFCQIATSKIENDLWFDFMRQLWTVTVKEYECAPAASCWEWITISCGGELSYYRGGED